MIITRTIRGSPREKLYQQLVIEYLQQRRWMRPFCLFYEVVAIYWKSNEPLIFAVLLLPWENSINNQTYSIYTLVEMTVFKTHFPLVSQIFFCLSLIGFSRNITSDIIFKRYEIKCVLVALKLKQLHTFFYATISISFGCFAIRSRLSKSDRSTLLNIIRFINDSRIFDDNLFFLIRNCPVN